MGDLRRVARLHALFAKLAKLVLEGLQLRVGGVLEIGEDVSGLAEAKQVAGDVSQSATIKTEPAKAQWQPRRSAVRAAKIRKRSLTVLWAGVAELMLAT